MAIKFGRIEGEVTVGSGGWDLRAQDDGGPFTATIPAASYSLRTFVTEVQTQLNASGTVTWTVTISNGEAGSGKVTISATGVTVSVLWNNAITNDNMWTLLGFADADSTGSTSYTGASSARMIWLPDGPKVTPFGDSDDGIEEDDNRATISPSGHVLTLGGNSRTRISITWNGISRARCRIAGETTANQSWQKFRQDAINGQGPGASRGGKLYLYWDADTTTSTSYRAVGAQLEKFVAEQLQQDWIEQWRIPLELMKVPT